MATVGVDPGKSGGLAYISKEFTSAIPMPIVVDGKSTGIDVPVLAAWVRMCRKHERIDKVALERVSAMPGQGVVSMFTFGKLYGEVRGALKAMKLKIIEPVPRVWKKKVLSNTAKDKTAAIDFATRNFPNLSLLPTQRCYVPSDGMADAVCLAVYAGLA